MDGKRRRTAHGCVFQARCGRARAVQLQRRARDILPRQLEAHMVRPDSDPGAAGSLPGPAPGRLHSWLKWPRYKCRNSALMICSTASAAASLDRCPWRLRIRCFRLQGLCGHSWSSLTSWLDSRSSTLPSSPAQARVLSRAPDRSGSQRCLAKSAAETQRGPAHHGEC